MAGVNKAILIGRLGRDPEIRYTPGGTAVANFSMATSENYTNRDGNREEKTEWHRIVAFGRLAEICGEYLAKGKEIYIEGRIQTRDWEDRDGNKRYTTEIVALTMQMLGRASDAPRESRQGDWQSGGDYGSRGGDYGQRGGRSGGSRYSGDAPAQRPRNESGGDRRGPARNYDQSDYNDSPGPDSDLGNPPGDDEIPF